MLLVILVSSKAQHLHWQKYLVDPSWLLCAIFANVTSSNPAVKKQLYSKVSELIAMIIVDTLETYLFTKLI